MVGKELDQRKSQGSISQGFVTATLIFLIGAMAILGALDSGIRGNHDILYTKGILDGFTALILTTTLGSRCYYFQPSLFYYIKADCPICNAD